MSTARHIHQKNEIPVFQKKAQRFSINFCKRGLTYSCRWSQTWKYSYTASSDDQRATLRAYVYRILTHEWKIFIKVINRLTRPKWCWDVVMPCINAAASAGDIFLWLSRARITLQRRRAEDVSCIAQRGRLVKGSPCRHLCTPIPCSSWKVARPHPPVGVAMCRGHCAVGPSCGWHVDSLSAATVYRRTSHRFCWGPTASAVIVTKAIKSERVNLWENMQGGDMIYTTQGGAMTRWCKTFSIL